MAFTQENRLMAIATPLGDDVLLLAAFSGDEGISRLFHYDLELLSTSESIDFEAIVGKNVTVRVQLPSGDDRYFNGFVNRFSQSRRDREMVCYQAEMVPWFWFLTRTSDCRIFQKKKVPDIVAQIFGEMNFKDYSFQLYGDFVMREYCVQYRETDFNFISRLLEEEGIFYFFQHQNGVHTLVLANDPAAHKACPGQERARYEGASGGATQEDDIVLEWTAQQEMRPGVYTQADYNFEQPSQILRAGVGGQNSYEIYDYHPGEYRKVAEGDGLAKNRLQELQQPSMVVRGASDCRAFTTGYKFDLTEHYRDDMNQAWVLTALHHRVSQPGDFKTQSTTSDDFHYQNSFECIPYSTPFRPPRVTPHPVVQGSQTAVVVGPKGEEIFVDQYGRVKVQFHWDREGKKDENSSCWIRVSQNWAGKKWGAIFTPRIGQEVIVDFLEGDPDQPIITGRVYNAEQMPPYALPDEKTKSTIKSFSSKGGGGFNEFRFEDQKGSEQIFIHAEKDLHERVKDSRFETILGSTNLIVQKDQFEQISGNTHLQVSGDQNEKISGTVSLTVGADLEQKVASKCALDAGQEIHLKSGMNLVIESGTTLTLKVGGNFINLNPSGVYISGTMLYLNSGGSAGTGSGASPESPADPTEAVNADPGEVTVPSPPKPVAPTPESLSSTPVSPAARALISAAQTGAPFCDI